MKTHRFSVFTELPRSIVAHKAHVLGDSDAAAALAEAGPDDKFFRIGTTTFRVTPAELEREKYDGRRALAGRGQQASEEVG